MVLNFRIGLARAFLTIFSTFLVVTANDKAQGSPFIRSIAKVGPDMILICLVFNMSLTISDRKEQVLFSIPLLAIQIGVFLEILFRFSHTLLTYLAVVAIRIYSVF